MKRFLIGLSIAALLAGSADAQKPGYAVSGTFTSSTTAGTVSAPFSCQTMGMAQGCNFNVAVSLQSSAAPGAALTATVYLTRSIDGGTTYLPITAAGTQLYSWTQNASEVVTEPNQAVLYELVCSTQPTATISYRISQ